MNGVAPFRAGFFNMAYNTPKTYDDCPPPTEACPHVGCRHNTYLDVSFGKIHINARLPPGSIELAPCCSLRYAERGGMAFSEIAEILGTTEGALWLVQEGAQRKLRDGLRSQEIHSAAQFARAGAQESKK